MYNSNCGKLLHRTAVRPFQPHMPLTFSFSHLNVRSLHFCSLGYYWSVEKFKMLLQVEITVLKNNVSGLIKSQCADQGEVLIWQKNKKICCTWRILCLTEGLNNGEVLFEGFGFVFLSASWEVCVWFLANASTAQRTWLNTVILDHRSPISLSDRALFF